MVGTTNPNINRKANNQHQQYLASGVWKCDKSPTGAHHWIGMDKDGPTGDFYCKYCLDTKRLPISYEGVSASSPIYNPVIKVNRRQIRGAEKVG